jgi:hypothetical protein
MEWMGWVTKAMVSGWKCCLGMLKLGTREDIFFMRGGKGQESWQSCFHFYYLQMLGIVAFTQKKAYLQVTRFKTMV